MLRPGRHLLPALVCALFVMGCTENTLVDGDFDGNDLTPRPGTTPDPTPTPTPPPNFDQDGDGVLQDQDCDDADASTFPGAHEACDDIDNDCNGVTDEGVSSSYYYDLDGDGYGSDTAVAVGCIAPPGFVENRGDCDDEDTDSNPDAEDDEGDGVDQDCGGSDGDDPGVEPPQGGSPGPEKFKTIQEAIDAADEGTTVWVPAGEYPEFNITFRGKVLTVKSMAGPEQTVVNAGGQGHVFLFDSAEGADSVLDGFTLINGDETDGGGVLMVASSPTLKNLIVRDNTASFGGGMYLAASDPVMENCVIKDNGARVRGGGLFIDYSSPHILGTTITGNKGTYAGGGANIELLSEPVFSSSVISGNEAWFGGGLYVSFSSPTLMRTTVSGNTAIDITGGGGGMYVETSEPTLTNSSLYNNSSSTHGGGFYSYDSSPIFANVLVSANRAAGNGGGIFTDISSVKISHTVVTGNVAGEAGGGIDAFDTDGEIFNTIVRDNLASTVAGGIDLWESAVDLKNCTITGNFAEENGGGVYLFGSTTTPDIQNTILAYNEPLNVYLNREDAAAPHITYSVFYADGQDDNHNLDGLDESNMSDEPDFLDYDKDGLPHDFHLAPTSELIDAGAPGVQDADGSRSDIGCFGGEAGNGWDLDGDGKPNYYWPGTLPDAPDGVDPKEFDCDDSDSLIQTCR